jgi:flagellar protein FliT
MTPALEDYEFISSLMGEMRVAATDSEWSRLVDLEKKCSQRVEKMKAQSAPAPLDENTRAQMAALILKILADDAEIRNRVEPWMEQLQRSMQATHQQRRLLETYLSC